MVLEETLIFTEDKDAEIFSRFLREKNCRVLKKNESTIFEETEICGTIGNFIRLIETKIESELRDSPKDPVTPERATPDPGKSAYPARGKVSFAESNARMLSSLKSTRDYVVDIMALHNPGDIIITAEEVKRMNEQIRNGFIDDLGNFPGKTFLDKIAIHGNHLTMEDNGVIESRPEGICLIKKIDPNDLVIERRPWRDDEVDRETLDQYRITPKIHIDFRTGTQLIIDSRIHFSCKLTEVEEVLQGLNTDEFSEDELKRNMVLKGLAIECVLDAIETAGRISLQDLTRNLKNVTLNLTNEEHMMVGHFSPEFINGIIYDLRKIGAVLGNDRKLRVAG